MAVYVDAAIWQWRGLKWCHLLADDIDELHRFALCIGVKRTSYQGPPRTATPHYDLTGFERRLAIEAGAIACSRQQIAMIARQARSGQAEKQQGRKQEGPPNGSPSIVSPREARLTKSAPTQEAQSSQEARIQVTATRGVRQ
jgi:hypothetical protein